MSNIEKLSPILSLITESKYLESRIADILDDLDMKLQNVKTEEINQAETLIDKYGYKAEIYGKPVLEWLSYIFEKVLSISDEADRKLIGKLIPLPVINYQYKQLVMGKEKEHIDSALGIKSYLSESTAKYHNRVVRTLYLPKLFTEHETEIFENAVNVLYGIFDKVIKEFETNPEYRSLFGFSEELEELILRENKCGCNIPIARIDIFYNEETEDFKFCEFNTDGTSAMNEDRELNIAFRKSKAFKEFAKKYKVTSYELFDTWVDEVIKLYRAFSGDSNAVPNVAIVDFMENATLNEFLIFKERFEQKGIKAQVCDIRNLHWDGKECLTDEGNKADVIYRRAVTSDIMAHFSEVGDFIAATKSGKVCLLGDFRTQIVHNKILFKILHMDETMKILTKKEQLFIKAHVPLTVSLNSAVLAENRQLSARVYENKDMWIIKPEDSYGSWGVHAGVECSDKAEWKKLVEQCTDQNYILQEFTNPYRLDNIDLASGGQEWTSTSNLTGLFVYNEKFSGVYSRISFDKMISTQYNEMTLPTMIVSL